MAAGQRHLCHSPRRRLHPCQSHLPPWTAGHGDLTSDFKAGAIVDLATWTAAQRPKWTRDERSASGKLLLTGLLKCATCGNRLRPWNPSAKERAKGTKTRYRCTNERCSDRPTIQTPLADELVTLAAFDRSTRWKTQESPESALSPLVDALALAQSRLDQALLPEVQDAAGDAWASMVKERRLQVEVAATALGQARSQAGLGVSQERSFSCRESGMTCLPPISGKPWLPFR